MRMYVGTRKVRSAGSHFCPLEYTTTTNYNITYTGNSYLSVFVDNAVGAAQVDVDGASAIGAVVGGAHDQVFDPPGVIPGDAIQVEISCAGHSEAEASLVLALAVQGSVLVLSELVLGGNHTFEDDLGLEPLVECPPGSLGRQRRPCRSRTCPSSGSLSTWERL